MVAAISGAASTDPPDHDKITRPPLLPSEKGNESIVARRPKSKYISSRYLSHSPSNSTSTLTTTITTSSSSFLSSRRCASPLLSRINSTPASTPLPTGKGLRPKRAQSVDRRRPSTPSPRPGTPVFEKQGSSGETSSACKMLISSTRSLSVSFQVESFSLPISKTRTPIVSNVRRATPERRRASPLRGARDGGENAKIEQHRWPTRIRQVNWGSDLLSRSLDYTGSGMVGRALHQSGDDEDIRDLFDGRLGLGLGNAELLKALQQNHSSVNGSFVAYDLNASDTDSVSSSSTSGVQDCGGKGCNPPRGIVVSARFWQEMNSRLRRLQDPGSPMSNSPVSRMETPSKFARSRKVITNTPSSPRTMASPVQGAARPASPSNLWTSSAASPLGGNPSPSWGRNSVNGSSTSSSNNVPSILSFSVDLQRRKVGENHVIEAHVIRLLYNHHLRWRLVNARADATFRAHKLNAERSLWNAWVSISELRHSVTLKRIKLLLLRKRLKITFILNAQMTYLKEWALIDREHSSSLVGATEALKASTLRLPVVGKANADIQNLKDAVSSAVDVMHAMASSICSLSSLVGDLNSLVTELANVTAKERMMLAQCIECLSNVAGLQVKDCSLRTHTLQLNRPTS